jgi:hypothetical protein
VEVEQATRVDRAVCWDSRRAHRGAADWQSAWEDRKVSSEYVSLHKYLANRHADSVVLTFAQLEDLMGCPLPDSARAQQEWWASTDGDADKSSGADAWILAGGTATPNLLARTVTFERPIESP